MNWQEAQGKAFATFAQYVGRARVDRLAARGHNVLEAKREGAYVVDPQGKRYLDCCGSAGIHNLGRRRPEIVAAMKAAMRRTDQGNFPLISIEKAALGERLAKFVGGGLECAMYSVTRGESFDFTCKLARGFTGRQELLALEGSWFGQTGFALSLSARPDRGDFKPLIPQTRTIPFGDFAAAEAAITEKTAALFIEPLQAENHCRTGSASWLRSLHGLCRAKGALLVIDETQTGFGRTGKRFAIEHYGVQPDVLNLGEALGGGLFPIAATMFSPRLNTFLNAHPLIHLSTFGGSDLGCAVAMATLDLYETAKPWENAAAMGAKIKAGLEDIVGRRRGLFAGVAGEGLLLSIAFHAPEKATDFCRALSGAGVLAAPGAVAAHTVVLRPSLTVTAEDADALLAAVRQAAEAM